MPRPIRALMVLAILSFTFSCPSWALLMFTDNPFAPTPDGGRSQGFLASNQFNIDSIRLDLLHIDGQAEFAPPVFAGFSRAGWTEASGSSFQRAVALGPATQELGFALNFTGTQADPVTFNFLAYDGRYLRDAARVQYDGSDWSVSQLSTWRNDSGVLDPVPEPSPSIMLALGTLLLGGGVFLKRRLA
jgi:hypothetical protein